MKKILIAMMFAALCACAYTAGVATIHPVAVDTMPNCGECHEGDGWERFDHKAGNFYDKHGFYAGEERASCSGCHAESFCSDCHTRNDEIKPSDKYFNSPVRKMPHRGDYVSLHRIDGKINPASCVKCHGRQDNKRCAPCHR